MKNWRRSLPILLLLAAASSAQGLYGQSQLPPQSSVKSSKRSAIPANDVLAACAAAADELDETRLYAAHLERENGALKERLATEKQMSAVLVELDATRKAEADDLRKAVEAKNETIAAKDSVIAAQEKLIENLKNKRRSPLARLGDILLGAAVISVLK